MKASSGAERALRWKRFALPAVLAVTTVVGVACGDPTPNLPDAGPPPDGGCNCAGQCAQVECVFVPTDDGGNGLCECLL